MQLSVMLTALKSVADADEGGAKTDRDLNPSLVTLKQSEVRLSELHFTNKGNSCEEQ